MAGEWQEGTLADVCYEVHYGYTAAATEWRIGTRLLHVTDIDDGTIHAERVLAHADVNTRALPELRGDMELLYGWDYGKNDHWQISKPLWMPGSACQEARFWRINDPGHWSLHD